MCVYIKTNNDDYVFNLIGKSNFNFKYDTEYNIEFVLKNSECEKKIFMMILDLTRLIGNALGPSNINAIFYCMKNGIPLIIVVDPKNESLNELIKKYRRVKPDSLNKSDFKVIVLSKNNEQIQDIYYAIFDKDKFSSLLDPNSETQKFQNRINKLERNIKETTSSIKRVEFRKKSCKVLYKYFS